MMMTRFPTVLAAWALAASLGAQDLDLPAPSPLASLSQRVGLTDLAVKYSRPSMKGRRVFGDLVPYGELWRTRANMATVFSTSGPLVIQGQKLPQGEYSVLTIPDQGLWTLIFNKKTDLAGTEGYSQEEDQLRVRMTVKPTMPTETFTIAFEDMGTDQVDLVLRWEKTEARVTIVAAAFDQAMLNIKAAIAEEKADYRTYARAASFCLDRKANLELALDWAQKSVGMEAKYWNTFTLAKLQAATGKYAEAVTTGERAVALAKEAKDASSERTYQRTVDEWKAKQGGK